MDPIHTQTILEPPPDPAFVRTAPELLPLLDELRQLEPIFHTPAFGASVADGERRMSVDYWEVGASGKRYSRAFISRHLQTTPPAFASDLGWTSSDHALRSLGPETYLLTYALQQGDRLTRRATIWQQDAGDWRILYHQGTLVSGDQDG